MSVGSKFTQMYIRSCGYSYTNLGRLFLRLFVGIMLLQFGVRHIAHFESLLSTMPSIAGLTPEAVGVIYIVIETVCSIFIMFGFITRWMTLPPLIALSIVEWYSHGFLPIMFLGIYFFILLVGPGKISVDYFLSLHLIHSSDKNENEELEEV